MTDQSIAGPAAETGVPSRTFCPRERRRYVLVAAILASSMGFIDGSVLSIAIPALRADLSATLADAQWVSNSYMLFLGSLILIGGAAGDRFGLKRVFGIGIGLFVAASLVCAVAPTPLSLIVARAVQGVGAALMVPGSLAIIAKAYPKDERGKAIGIWAAASSLTTILGPVIGGFVLTMLGDWSWRLVFAINLPLGAIALALLWLRVPADEPAGTRALDLPGAFLASLGLMLIAFGLTGGSSESVPPVSHILSYAGTGLLVFIGFLFWESRSKEPMLPLRLFANMGFSGANALTLTLYFALSAVMFFLPMTMIAGWGVSAAEVSISFLPLGIALTILSSWAGSLADRFGPAPLIAGGATLVGFAFAGLGLTAPLQNVWGVVLPLIALMGVGMGLVVSPLSTAVMTAVEDADTGTASGVNNAVARVAGLLAVATMGFVAAFAFNRFLGDAAGSGMFFGLKPEDTLPPEAEAARLAATNATFAVIAYINAGLSFVSAVIAWLTLEKKG
ncbi:MFS transporter [Devosia nitrariae]|uniref:MFS transporter n=1 Tax=Devosia nitrariae TaxID=2071872 RepID=A0ABQ5W1Y1_9HYPH|nr:MFS transporter [Devosia nitrariae]GLQ54077.1 MFS transporter [Devosia nitrariae]